MPAKKKKARRRAAIKKAVTSQDTGRSFKITSVKVGKEPMTIDVTLTISLLNILGKVVKAIAKRKTKKAGTK